MSSVSDIVKNYRSVLAFNGAYILPASFYFFISRNYEFLWYLAVLIVLFSIVLLTLHKSRFTNQILMGLSIWGALHLAGGAVRVGESVLYDWVILPLVSRGDIVILKFDQALHFYGFALTTCVGHHLLKHELLPQASPKTIGFILFGFGMGMGALNEVVEFCAVLMAPETGVGGYVNTALDLTFNMLGVLFALFVLNAVHRQSSRRAQA